MAMPTAVGVPLASGPVGFDAGLCGNSSGWARVEAPIWAKLRMFVALDGFVTGEMEQQ